MKREVERVDRLRGVMLTSADIRALLRAGWEPKGLMEESYWFTRDLPEEPNRTPDPIATEPPLKQATEAPHKDVTVLEGDGFSILWRDRHDVNTLKVTEVKGRARLTITKLD